MIAPRTDDDGVGGRATIEAEGRVGYAVPRAPRRRRRFVLPAAAIGIGLALGGAGLVALELL